ncbi:hypothetical protein [Novosphingobium huizhouense]|uniref:hypothetical protein n=1 Tax=Novosphingobium huizhouense TaxID=2866625 RepID=UPI001CD8975C|nr:hypothetical protein [Novosphingobium huizhouense]
MSAKTNHAANAAELRAQSKKVRRGYTDTLHEHGVAGRGYMVCTEAINRNLLGAGAKRLREMRGLRPKANLRDHMDWLELSFVMAAEAMSAERIRFEDRRGTSQCCDATARSAARLRAVLDDDRASWQRPLI